VYEIALRINDVLIMYAYKTRVMTSASSSLPPELLEKYRTQLKTRRAELDQFVARAEQSAAGPGEIAAARIHAHSLKGTGRTYGYPDISATAAAMEDAMDKDLDQTALAALARAVVASCDHAIAMAAENPAPVREDNRGEQTAEKVNMPPRRAKPLMLVVDDDPAIRGMLQQLLSRDADIFTASDSKEALALIREKKPDLVVLDDRMPGMTGLELLEHLRADGSALPAQIVMLTANNHTPDIISGMSAGAVDYITKPFEPDRLISRIRSLLRCLNTTILIADDDAAVQGLLRHKFRMLGFRLVHAEDGEEAMRLARETRPQLAIIDRMMPGFDGLAVLQMMREEERLRDIPVILLTAKRQNKDVVEGFHLGATDYIVKPFMPDEVVARAMRLLGFNETGRP
jgi:DNA-binding response OmpR family regulator/HPt (histidine-containing phosphotransfer) domain-containing protein